MPITIRGLTIPLRSELKAKAEAHSGPQPPIVTLEQVRGQGITDLPKRKPRDDSELA